MAEALVGGAFLSAALQVLFQKLASRPVLDFIRGQKKLSNNLLNKLKIKLLAVNVVLNDAEAKQITDPLVKQWLDELKDAVYVAEDLLDDISTEAQRCKLEAESHASSEQVWNISSSSLNSFDEGMKSKIEEILDTLEYCSNQKDLLGLKQVGGGKLSQRLPTTSLVDESIVYGRDDDKEKIINFLLSDDATSGHEIGVMAIMGMGGVGKTTLAQLVYNDTRMEDCFDLKAWVCVSEEFDVLRITKTILEALNPSSCHSTDLNLLQVRLKESLIKKKFLLILDDVWNENYNDWDSLRSPFRFGAKGSKIIVTTRNEKVALVMGRGPTHHLKQLLDEDCWLLFAKHAFDNHHSSNLQELEFIGKKIVKKCKGLPLAAKTLGGLLRSKANVADWNTILESELWELSYDESSILPALRLSYHYLPSHLKRCFAYCSIFPKDYEFEMKQVVLLWMAEDFLQELHKNKQMEDVGNMYFNDLISRSFFQRSSRSISHFVMHDFVNDLAKYVSGAFSFKLEDENLCEIPEKTRHFSYSIKMCDTYRKFKTINVAKALRTFLPINFSRLSRAYYLTNKVPQDIIPTLRCLRVLSLSQYKNICELPDSIGGLRHLRYLDLSSTSIRKLPDSTSTLCNLQTLLLHNCGQLNELPKNMGKLINLRHLDVRRTKLKEMPMHVSRLKNLQTLSTFIVGKHNGSTIKELRELNDLHGGLDILKLENVIKGKDAQECNLKDKAHIEELLLQWSIETEDTQIARDVLDKLQPQAKLKKLTIERYGGTRFPDWLGEPSFSNMVFLRLSNCKYCLTLPPVGRLLSLRELLIEGFNEVVAVGPEFYGKDSSAMKPFGLLEKLTFEDMPELEEWFCSAEEVVEFVCLRELCIVNCPKLEGLLPSHLPCLTTLKLVNCDQLVMFGGNDDANLQPSVDVPEMPPIPIQLQHYSWPCLNQLEISKLSHLKELPAVLMQSLSAIEYLRFWSCTSFESLPMSDLPTTLKKLMLHGCPKLDLLLPNKTGNQIQMGQYSDASLEDLTILRSCDTLKSFPLGLFPKLTSLYLEECKNLESLWIPEGVNLTSLHKLHIYSCPKLESFPNGGLAAPNLTNLRVEGCKSLKSLPEGMHNLLPSLQYLSVGYFPELESFPEGGLPSNLEGLNVRNCAKLTARRMEWGLQTLPNLKSFSIGFEEDIVDSFPEEWLLPSSLTSLLISSLPNMKYLNQRGLQRLTSLQDLYFWECPKLQCLLEEGPLPNSISSLQISVCPLLEKWCQREKGEGWPKIAHIPNLVINGELKST